MSGAVWGGAGLAAIGAAVFVWTTRLPLPFDGFAMLAAGALAFTGTLALIAWLPRRWVWRDQELLQQAFSERHDLSQDAAAASLEAITTAHARAETLRKATRMMREDIVADIEALADQLDGIAREIFYLPERRRDLRSILLRSELVEEAALAHAALRSRQEKSTEDASREKLRMAVASLRAALADANLTAAQTLLQQVEVASDVAEQLLKPRQRLT